MVDEFESKHREDEAWIDRVIKTDSLQHTIRKDRDQLQYTLTSDPSKTGNKHFYNMLRPTFYKRKVENKIKELARKNQKFTQRQMDLYLRALAQQQMMNTNIDFIVNS